MSASSSSLDSEGKPADPGTGISRNSSEAEEAAGKAARRRLVDELIATGVPAVAAEQASRGRGRGLAGLYVVISVAAVALLFGLGDSPRSETPAPRGAPIADSRGGVGRKLDVSAQNISFDTDELRLRAGAQTVIHFENRDSSSTSHNVAIYQDAEANDPIFQGKIIPGGTDIDYDFTAPGSGEYFFRCDVHPSMNGTSLSNDENGRGLGWVAVGGSQRG